MREEPQAHPIEARGARRVGSVEFYILKLPKKRSQLRLEVTINGRFFQIDRGVIGVPTFYAK